MSMQEQKPKNRSKALTEEERREQMRQRSREWYQKLKQEPEKWEKHVAKLRENRNRTDEQKKKYRAYYQNYREKLLSEPESTKEYRAKSRMNAKAYMQKIRTDSVKWLRFLLLHRRLSREYYRTLTPEDKKRWLQRSAEFQAKHKQRMENDPHYAHYHKEYEKAKNHERTGKPIDPNQPR